MNLIRSTFKISFLLLILFQALNYGLKAQNLVTYAGNTGKERFNDVVELSNGKVLVAAEADNLTWLPAGTPITTLTVNLAPGISSLNSNDSRVAFLMLLNSTQTTIEQVVRFPAGTVASVNRIRTTNQIGSATGNMVISGMRTTTSNDQDGYFIARLNNNFVAGVPTSCMWYFPVSAKNVGGPSAYKTIQPWDVGNEGSVVFGMGVDYDWNWAAIHKLDPSGKMTTVENWPYHVAKNGNLESEHTYKTASSTSPGTGSFSGIVLKAYRKGSLRSSVNGTAFWNGYNYDGLDENNNPRKGKFPDDFFAPEAEGVTPSDGRSYGRLTQGTNYNSSLLGYKTNFKSTRPTARLGGIVIDRRDNHLYFGYSTQTAFGPGTNWIPDFEPVVVAMDNTGGLKWWARLYNQKGISLSDQYIDGVDIDYASDRLVVLARQHGFSDNMYFQGNKLFFNGSASGFKNSNSGINTSESGHYSWIGKYDLIRTPVGPIPVQPKLMNSTFIAEYTDNPTGLGARSNDPKLDNWFLPNSGFPDLNTTKMKTRINVAPNGSVTVVGTGRRTLTTVDAYQKMPKPGTGSVSSWNQFIRVYRPDLSFPIYSSLLTGAWDTLSGAGGSNTEIEAAFPFSNGVYVAGYHTTDATGSARSNYVTTTNIPSWGTATPKSESAIFGRLRFVNQNPISLNLNQNTFCSQNGSNTASISFTPPPNFLVNFNPGNQFQVELSNSLGKFQEEGGATTLLGSLSSTSNSTQSLLATIPNGTLKGNKYGIRVRATNPVTPGFWYSATIVSAAPLTPDSIFGPNQVCSNSSTVTNFSIRKVDDATSYEWEVSPTVSNQLDPCDLPGCAGKISGTDTVGSVVWNPAFSGPVTVRVRALNPCGPSSRWDTLTNISVAPCVTTGFQATICTGPNLSSVISFTIPTGVKVLPVNTFSAQLSDRNGNFSPGSTIIGTISNLPTGNGPITSQINGFTIPTDSVASTKYRIRFVATGTSPTIQGLPGSNFTIRTPPTKPSKPIGINQLCYNNIKTGSLNVTKFTKNAGLIQLNINSHGLQTGQKIFLNMSAPAPVNFNGVWTITKIGNDDILLNGSSYSGQDYFDSGQIVWNYFSITSLPEATNYEWKLSNPALGSFQTSYDANTIIDFNNVEGSSWLKVRGINECGAGAWSDSIQIFVENCIKVNLEPSSVWCPGSMMDRTSAGGTIKLQVSKAAFINPNENANYRVEISDQTGSFISPLVYSANLFWCDNQAFTGRVTAVTNGPGKILLTIPNHGLYSGANVKLNGFSNGYNLLNNTRDSITVIDANTIRLERAVVCASGCTYTPTASIVGHDLKSPVDIRVPLPSGLLPSSFYKIRVLYFSSGNCTNSASIISSPIPFTVGPPTDNPIITGTTSQACTKTYTYSTPLVPGATAYTWTLVPAAAGTITGSGNSISVTYSNVYSGPYASLTLKVTTPCGEATSIPLQIGTNCNGPTEPPIPGAAAGSYRSKTNGPWKSAASWEVFDGTNWNAATAYPGNDGSANDDPAAPFIYIGGAPPSSFSHTISLDGAISADQIVVNKVFNTGVLTINSGATLTILNGAELVDCQVKGDLVVNQDGNIITTGTLGFLSNGRYRHNYTTTPGTIPTANWYPASTCQIEGYTTNNIPPAGLNQPFQHFNFACANIGLDFNFKGNLTSVYGTFSNNIKDTQWLTLTDINSTMYFNRVENYRRFSINRGVGLANSATLTVNRFTNFNWEMYGSENTAPGNLIVNEDMKISGGNVRLTKTVTDNTWLVRGNLIMSGDCQLQGHEGWISGQNSKMVVQGNVSLTSTTAILSGGSNGTSNFDLTINGNLNLSNGSIVGNRNNNQVGVFNINVKGDFLQDGGKFEDSWVVTNLNIGGNYTQTGGDFNVATSLSRARVNFGFYGSGTQTMDVIPASFNPVRSSYIINKSAGILNISDNLVGVNWTWIKGNVNISSQQINLSADLILNGSGAFGLLSGTGSFNSRRLNTLNGALQNPSDLITITGGTGGAVNGINPNSYVTDFLKFTLNSKLVSNATFGMSGNWSGDATITLNNHGLLDGDKVIVAGTTNDGGAFNGTYTVSNPTANSFSLKNKYFPGNWNSSNTGTLTRLDNFEVPIGNSSGYQGFSFEGLQNDLNIKTFRISYKSTGPNQASGIKIRNVGLVPVILGKNWRIERLAGSGTLESLGSISLYEPAGSSNLRIGQSTTSPGTIGYLSQGGLFKGARLSSTKSLDINGINSTTGTWLAIGLPDNITPPGGGFTVGPTGDYPNLTSVAAEYNDVQFTAPTTFTFQSTYEGRSDNSGTERFPITFFEKQTQPVTIRYQGSSKIETSNSSISNTSPIVIFDGADKISFQGNDKWRFLNKGTGTNANAVRLQNGATGNSIKDMILEASEENAGFTGTVFLGSSPTIGNSNNTFESNRISSNADRRLEPLVTGISNNFMPGLPYGVIIGATNALPIEITTAKNHGFSTGQNITIEGVHGNYAANGNWKIKATGPKTFTLDNSTGSGNFRINYNINAIIANNPVTVQTADQLKATINHGIPIGTIQPISWPNLQGLTFGGTNNDGDYYAKAISATQLQIYRNIGATTPLTITGGTYIANTGYIQFLTDNRLWKPQGSNPQLNTQWQTFGNGSIFLWITNAVKSGSGLVEVTTSANHNMISGWSVRIADVVGTGGNFAQEVNRYTGWQIDVTGPDKFTLRNSNGNNGGSNVTGSYISGGRFLVSPIVVSATNHGVTSGKLISINGVQGVYMANGTHYVRRLDDNAFSIWQSGSNADSTRPRYLSFPGADRLGGSGALTNVVGYTGTAVFSRPGIPLVTNMAITNCTYINNTPSAGRVTFYYTVANGTFGSNAIGQRFYCSTNGINGFGGTSPNAEFQGNPFAIVTATNQFTTVQNGAASGSYTSGGTAYTKITIDNIRPTQFACNGQIQDTWVVESCNGPVFQPTINFSKNSGLRDGDLFTVSGITGPEPGHGLNGTFMCLSQGQGGNVTFSSLQNPTTVPIINGGGVPNMIADPNPPFSGQVVSAYDVLVSKLFFSQNTGNSLNSNNKIKDNELSQFDEVAVSVTSLGNGGNWEITGNSIFNRLSQPPAAGSSIFQAVNFVPGLRSNSNSLSGNFIGGQTSKSEGNAMVFSRGVSLVGFNVNVGNEVVTKLENNVIKNLNTVSFSGSVGAVQGFNIQNGRVDVKNNIFGGTDNKTAQDTIKTGGNYADYTFFAKVSSSDSVAVSGNSIGHIQLPASSGNFLISMEGSGKYYVGKNRLYNTNVGYNYTTGGGLDVIRVGKRIASTVTVSGSTITMNGHGAAVGDYIRTGEYSVSSNQFAKYGYHKVASITDANNFVFATGTGLTPSGTNPADRIMLIKNSNISITVDSNQIFRHFIRTAGGDLPMLNGINVYVANIKAVIKRNRFFDNTISPSQTALNLMGPSVSPGAEIFVANNQFTILAASGNGNSLSSGIKMAFHNDSDASKTKLYFNTIWLRNNSGAGPTQMYGAIKYGPGLATVKNNIFYVAPSTNPGSSAYGFGAMETTNWGNGSAFTNNLMYAEGSNAFLGLFNTTPISTIANWQGFAGAGSKDNLFSYASFEEVQPSPIGNLHLTSDNCPIKDKGINVSYLSDYDSVLVRNVAKPDIGSNEFSRNLPLGAFWTGEINTDWNLDGNWCDQRVPLAEEDVTITNAPVKPNMPIVSSNDAVCRNIKIIDNPGSMLTVWGDIANLTFFGASGKVRYTHDNLAHISGKITFGSDSAQSIPAPVATLNSNRTNLGLIPLQIASVNLGAESATVKTIKPHNLKFGEFVKFAKVKGVIGLEGSFKIYRTIDLYQFEVFGSFSGTHVANSGYAVPLAVFAIRDILINGSTLTVQTSQNHGLNNDQYVAITGANGIKGANGAFKIFNSSGNQFDITANASGQFKKDTNAVAIPSRTGYYDLNLTGDNWKVPEGNISGASITVSRSKFLGNKATIELRDSLVAEQKALIQIDSGIVSVGGNINSGTNPATVGNGILGLISSDSSTIVFNNNLLLFSDSIVTRNAGKIELKKGSVHGKFIHAGNKGIVNQSEASVTVYQELIASSKGKYQLSGSKDLTVRDSIWVKRNGLIETISGSSGHIASSNYVSLLGGNINLNGSGNLHVFGLDFKSGKIFTTTTNRVIMSTSNASRFFNIWGGSDSSFVHGKLSHWYGRPAPTTLNLTGVNSTSIGAEFVVKTTADHGFIDGDVVLIQGVTTTNLSRCNGTYTVKRIDPKTLQLVGSVTPTAIPSGPMNGTIVRLYSRYFALGKDNEYRRIWLHLDHGTLAADSLSIPLTGYSNSNNQAVYTTSRNHNYRNRQPVSILGAGQSSITDNDIRYIRVLSPNTFQIFDQISLTGLNNSPGGSLSGTAKVLGHSEYVAEAFNSKPDSLKNPVPEPSYFGNWSDQVKAAHQGRYFKIHQISHLPGQFKFNGAASTISYKQNEISPSFHNNKYLSIVKDSLWPTPALDKWIHLRGNNVDSLQPLKTIQSVKPFQTTGVITLGFMNIIPCNHRADAGKDTVICQGTNFDSLGTKALTGYSYRWRRLDTWQTGSTRSDSLKARLRVNIRNAIAFNDTVRFELTMSKGLGCEKKDTVSVVVLPELKTPILNPSGNITYSQNPNNTIFTYLSAFQTYNWQVIPASAGSILGSGDTIQVDWNDGYVGLAKVVLNVGNKCDTIPSDTVKVTISPINTPVPSTPVSASGTLFCINPSNINISVSPVTGATGYIWTALPVAAGTISGTTTSAVFDAANGFSGNVAILVRAIIAGGETANSGALNLTVTPKDTSIRNISSCKPYSWNGILRDTTGQYMYTKTGVPCDTVMVLNLTITPKDTSIINVSRCKPYSWNGILRDTTGQYIFIKTGATAAECDTVMVLNLTITPKDISIINVSRCKPYNWNGISRDTTGQYIFIKTGATVAECDTVMVLNLTITPKDTSIINVSRCKPYNWNGISRDTTGQYIFIKTGATVAECDTVMVLNLTITPKDTSIINVSRCKPYSWNGISRDTTGQYIFIKTGATVAECDTVMVLNLTITPKDTSIINISRCKSYDWNGISRDTTGQYIFIKTGATVAECDTVMVLNLTITPKDTSIINVSRCKSYDWNGILRDTTGQYIFIKTGATAAECDTVMVLNLTITPKDTSIINVSRCKPYNWNGISRDTTGQYIFIKTGATVAECDTVMVLNLTITPKDTSIINVSRCKSYDWNGILRDTTGQYIFIKTGATAAECDTVMVLNLTITPKDTSIINVSRCKPYDWNGISRDTTGQYIFIKTGATAAVCDTVMVLNLTITPKDTSIINISRCKPYNWNGISRDTTGQYIFIKTGATVAECDTVMVLNLTITPKDTSIINVSRCKSYDWNGILRDTTGQYIFIKTGATAAECDTVMVLNLTITPKDTSIINISRCKPYNWNGISRDTTGQYIFIKTGATVAECDTVMVLNLTITPKDTSIINVSRCKPYSWNGISRDTTGQYIFIKTGATVAECDTVMVLNLTITPKDTSIINISRCKPYNWNGISRDTTGQYIFIKTGATVAECDTVMVLNLTITPKDTSIINVSRCKSYDWNGILRDTTGQYIFIKTGATVAECDTVMVLNLTITPKDTSIINISRCKPYNWNGISRDTTGQYIFIKTGATAAECDTVMVLNLTITPKDTSIINISRCKPYNWNGISRDTTGQYIFIKTGATVAECDTVMVLNLTITPKDTSIINVSRCKSYDWNGILRDTTGQYIFIKTGATAAECDTVMVLNLTITPKDTSIINISRCKPYNWNGISRDTTGQYIFIKTGATVAECDTVMVLNLTITPKDTSIINISRCKPYNWNGISRDTTGQYIFIKTGATAAECDTVMVLNLTITPKDTSIINISRCKPYNWNGISRDTTGQYIFIKTGATVAECDTVMVLNLTITPKDTSIINISRCKPYSWNGISRDTTGQYIFIKTGATVAECDTVMVLNLTITPKDTSIINVSRCKSYDWNGILRDTTGQYIFIKTGATAAECDTVMVLNLTITPKDTSIINISRCKPYNWNGISRDTTGQYIFIKTGATAAVCDTVMVLNLTITSKDTSYTSITTCKPYLWHGILRLTTGQYSFDTLTAVGCDSVAILNLTINPLLPTNIFSLDTSYCQQNGGTISLQSNPAGGIFKINGLQNSQLSLNTPGLFTIKYELSGCYDSSIVKVRIKPKTATSIIGLDTLYCQSNQPFNIIGNPAGGLFTGQGILGNTFRPGQIGNFTISYNVVGCSDTTRKKVLVKAAPIVSISAAINAFCQDTTAIPLSLNPLGGQLISNGIVVPKFRPQTPGINKLVYRVKTANCQSSDSLFIRVDTRPVVSLVSFGTNTICGFDTLIPLYATPKGGFYNSTAVVDSSLNPKFLSSGNQRITYYALNGVCKDSSSKIFNILPVPLVITGPIDTLCHLGPIFSLTGFSPSGGVWSGANVSAIGEFNPIRSGFNQLFYKVSAQAGFSCAGKASKWIFVTPKPKMTFPEDTAVCEGSNVQLNPLYSRALSWKWQDGSINPFYLASEPGSYFVELKDKFCTWNSDTFTIRKKTPLPVFSFGRDSLACFNYPAIIKGPSNMAKYEWTYIDSNTVLSRDSVFEMKDPAGIKLTVKSKDGSCYFTDDLILIEKLCDEFHIPQAFSPNGDGENDYWKLFGVNAEKILVKVFNEWGECVYYSANLEEKWDGNYNGKKCSAGAYQYVVEYAGTTPRGRKFKERKDGVIYLVK